MSDKKTKSLPAGVPELTFAELVAHMIASEVDFKFACLADNPPETRFGAWVHGETAEGSDPTVTLLTALAVGVRSEEARAERHSANLSQRKDRLAKIKELIPAVTAHAPGPEKCDACGEVHTAGGPKERAIDTLMNGLGQALGLKVTKVSVEPRPRKPRDKKSGN
jgi:hypothetical protein